MGAPRRGRRSPREASQDGAGERFERVLLASEGRSISNAAIERVRELSVGEAASARVISIARVHGVPFGLQTPGLFPSKAEWNEQGEIVSDAVKRLRRKGIDADGRVVGTRAAAKRICQEAVATGCDAIVMTADRDRGILIRDFMWSQEPQRVRRRARRAKLPVFLVVG